MGHKGRAVLAAAAVITVGLGLSACNEDGDGDAAAKESPVASVSAQAPASAEPAEEGPAAGGDVTAPGTKLTVGDRAVLPFEYTSEKKKVENVGGTDLSYASLKLDGDLEGGAGTGVVLIGDLPGKCERESAPADFTTKGASFETCSLSATKTAPVVAASFDEGDAYEDEPVVWAAG
ncbi:hypothetical protein ACFUZA_26355 [Streptomyces cellulosae]|uniref:hypothetical protein n=1 Tax=Streptomyces cellulosae TaxID=1968 RepID=UPI0036881910